MRSLYLREVSRFDILANTYACRACSIFLVYNNSEWQIFADSSQSLESRVSKKRYPHHRITKTVSKETDTHKTNKTNNHFITEKLLWHSIYHEDLCSTPCYYRRCSGQTDLCYFQGIECSRRWFPRSTWWGIGYQVGSYCCSLLCRFICNQDCCWTSWWKCPRCKFHFGFLPS